MACYFSGPVFIDAYQSSRQFSKRHLRSALVAEVHVGFTQLKAFFLMRLSGLATLRGSLRDFSGVTSLMDATVALGT